MREIEELVRKYMEVSKTLNEEEAYAIGGVFTVLIQLATGIASHAMIGHEMYRNYAVNLMLEKVMEKKEGLIELLKKVQVRSELLNSKGGIN